MLNNSDGSGHSYLWSEDIVLAFPYDIEYEYVRESSGRWGVIHGDLLSSELLLWMEAQFCSMTFYSYQDSYVIFVL